MNKKILIIGNSAKEYALAKFLSKTNEVFIAPGTKLMKDFATCLDIREDATTELLEFVMENSIDLTIPTSDKSLHSDIVNLFNKHNQAIFAPSKEAAELIFDKAATKKVLYKLRIPTPKFGIFEKQNMVMDYIKNLKNPFVLKTNEVSSAVVFTSPSSAKSTIDTYFNQKNQRIIIEDYIWGTPFCFYIITDGYKALPIGSSIIYKHSLDGDGGQLTNGMGSCSPNYKLSLENEYFLMDNVVYPIIEYIETNYSAYVGILGFNGILTEDGQIQILGFTPFLQDCDCNSIINLIDTNIYQLLDSCIIGSFSDEVDEIPLKGLSSTSLVLTCKNKINTENIINGIEFLDDNTLISFYPTTSKNRYLELEVACGQNLVLTSLGRTASTSTARVYEDVKNISYNGLYYRKDICKPLHTAL
jgi:phosphoribosylamine--glycine ligase